MKVLSQARRICGYQLRILRGNYKLYLINRGAIRKHEKTQ